MFGLIHRTYQGLVDCKTSTRTWSCRRKASETVGLALLVIIRRTEPLDMDPEAEPVSFKKQIQILIKVLNQALRLVVFENQMKHFSKEMQFLADCQRVFHKRKESNANFFKKERKVSAVWKSVRNGRFGFVGHYSTNRTLGHGSGSWTCKFQNIDSNID